MEKEVEKEIRRISAEVMNQYKGHSTFSDTDTTYHTHTGFGSSPISFKNLIQRQHYVHVIVPTTSAQVAGNYPNIVWVAPFQSVFVGATEVHAVAGTDASAVTVNIEHLTGTTAPGSGTSLLASPFNMKATANTAQTATLASIAQNNFQIAKGDRIALVTAGTFTSVTSVVFVLQLQY